MNEEAINETTGTEAPPEDQHLNETLESTIQTQFEKVKMSGLLSGAKAVSGVILNYISDFKKAPGKKTFRQQERLIKQIESFCRIGLQRTINENGDIVPIEANNLESETASEV